MLCLEQIDQKHKRREQQQQHDQAYPNDEQPVLPRVLPQMLAIADEQVVVTAVRLPSHVRYIPDDWYGTEGVLDGQVEHHAHYRDARGPTFPCRKYKEQGR